MVLRKLLYHRVVDDEVATYVTDYVTGGLCLVFSAMTALAGLKACFSKRESRKYSGADNCSVKASCFTTDNGTLIAVMKDAKISTSCKFPIEFAKISPTSGEEVDIAEISNCSIDERGFWQQQFDSLVFRCIVSMVFATCGIMHVLGGLVHQYVKTVDMTQDQNQLLAGILSFDDKTNLSFVVSNTVQMKKAFQLCYVAWQMADIAAGILAASFVACVPYAIAAGKSDILRWRMSQGGVNALERSVESSRSRASTDASTAALFASFSKDSNSCNGVNSRSFKHIFQTLAFVMAVLSVAYYCWNISAYVGSIASDKKLVQKLEGNIRHKIDWTFSESSVLVAITSDKEAGFQRDYTDENSPASTTVPNPSGTLENSNSIYFSQHETNGYEDEDVSAEAKDDNAEKVTEKNTLATVQISFSDSIESGVTTFTFSPMDFSSMWKMDAVTLLLGLSVFVYACFATYLTLSYMTPTEKGLQQPIHDDLNFTKKKQRYRSDDAIVVIDEDTQPPCNLQPTFSNSDFADHDQREDSESSQSTSSLRSKGSFRGTVGTCGASEAKVFFRVTDFFRKTSPAWYLTLRSVSLWLILISGVIQFSFADSCGLDHTHQGNACPFSESFNHNGVYHVMLGVSMTLLFIAEQWRNIHISSTS